MPKSSSLKTSSAGGGDSAQDMLKDQVQNNRTCQAKDMHKAFFRLIPLGQKDLGFCGMRRSLASSEPFMTVYPPIKVKDTQTILNKDIQVSNFYQPDRRGRAGPA
jgi:hypothetical protein